MRSTILFFSMIFNLHAITCSGVRYFNYKLRNSYLIFILENKQVYHVSLKEDNTVTLDWLVDYIAENVEFEVHLPSKFQWFAFGFSDRGDLFPADYCILWYDWKKKLHFQVKFCLQFLYKLIIVF